MAKTVKALAKNLVQIKILKDKLEAEEKAIRKQLSEDLDLFQKINIKEEGRFFIVTMKEVKETILADNQKIIEEIGLSTFKLIAKITKSALEAVKGTDFVNRLIVSEKKVPRLFVEEV